MSSTSNLILCSFCQLQLIQHKINFHRYIIERKDLGDVASDWTIVSRDLADTTLTLTDFDVGRDYLYRVRANNDYGLSEPSMVASYHAKSGSWRITNAKIFGTNLIEHRCPPVSVPKSRLPLETPSLPKEKHPPKAPREKPAIHDVTATSLRLTWTAAEFAEFAEKTEIFYCVERRFVECFILNSLKYFRNFMFARLQVSSQQELDRDRNRPPRSQLHNVQLQEREGLYVSSSRFQRVRHLRSVTICNALRALGLV